MSRFLKGCYMDLLTAQFNIGHLSMDEVRTVLGADFQAAWPTLQKKFRQNPEGLFFNARLDLQIKKKLAYNKSRNNNLEGDGRDSSRHMGNGYDSGLGSDSGFVLEKSEKPFEAKLIHPLQKHIAEKYQRVSKIEMQLTYDECERLCANYDKRLIDEVLQAMDNYKNLTKKYVSVNLTIQNWIKKRISDGESKSTFKANGSDRGAHSDEELIRGVEKRMREKQQSGSV